MKPIELISQDLDATYSFIDKIDQQLFKFRGWMLIATSAVIAYGVTHQHKGILFANFIICLAFYILELIYKAFQNDIIEHQVEAIDCVQRYISEEENWLGSFVYGYGKKIKAPSLKRIYETAKHGHMWHISLIYSLPVIFSVGAYYLPLYD